MKVIQGVELKPDSREELLPGFLEDFPYIASYVELGQFPGRGAPWHWHKEVEIFYVKEGELEYQTPGGRTVYPAGSGGFINSNVLHMSRAGNDKATALLHLFDPLFISGSKGSAIDRKYVIPLISNLNVEIMGFYPGCPDQDEILAILRRSFELTEEDAAYEIQLRGMLSQLWCGLLKESEPLREKRMRGSRMSEKVKVMMIYIHEHYAEKITAEEIAQAAYCSGRECYRVFHECLNTSPVEYITSCRLQKACQMLVEGNEPVTLIAQSCGLGSSSYFGKVFREHIGCSPREYREKWQNNDIDRR